MTLDRASSRPTGRPSRVSLHVPGDDPAGTAGGPVDLAADDRTDDGDADRATVDRATLDGAAVDHDADPWVAGSWDDGAWEDGVSSDGSWQDESWEDEHGGDGPWAGDDVGRHVTPARDTSPTEVDRSGSSSDPDATHVDSTDPDAADHDAEPATAEGTGWTAPTRKPWWRRLAGPASVQAVTALQLVLAVAIGVVLSDGLSPATKAGLVLALGAVVVLAAWPVGDRRAVVVLVDLAGYLARRAIARWTRGAGDAAAVLPPLVVGRADGPDGPEMGVVHDGSGWSAVAVVTPRDPVAQGDEQASWLPETVEALGRDDVDRGAQVLLERDVRGVETLVAVRVRPDSSPAGGVLGSVAGVAPLLRHRLRVVDEALEPFGLAVRALDPAEVVGQLTRAFALDDADGPPDADGSDVVRRPGEHRTCVISPRGVEQVVAVRSAATAPAEVACELEALALRLPGRVTVAVDVEDGGWVDGALVRVGVGSVTSGAALAAATRRAMPPGADLLLPHWRQAPRYAATLPLGRADG